MFLKELVLCKAKVAEGVENHFQEKASQVNLQTHSSQFKGKSTVAAHNVDMQLRPMTQSKLEVEIKEPVSIAILQGI